MAWGRAGSTTSSENDANTSVSSISDSESGIILNSHIFSQDATGANSDLTFNDSTSGYYDRYEQDNGGDVTSSHTNAIRLDEQGHNWAEKFSVVFFVNDSGSNKLCIWDTATNQSNIMHTHGVGKWENTAVVNKVAIAGKKGADSKLTILGDGTPTSTVSGVNEMDSITNIQANTIFEDETTGKHYVRTSTSASQVSDNGIYSSHPYWHEIGSGNVPIIAGEYGGVRGLFAGGYDASDETATIEYITFATLGNATDFGDRTENRMKLGACADGTKACFAGGESANSDTIDYVTILTTGNATDFGNLTSARNGQGGCTTSVTRGLFSGGGSVTTTIDYITIATTGNATDFGDHSAGHGTCTVSSLTRALIHIHEGTSDYYNEDIEYVTIDTTGNATDFGDIIEGKSGTGAVTNLTRAVIGGGKYTSGASNVRATMDYVTIATLGNGTDFGDLTSARSSLAGCSSTTRGVFGGGYNGSNFNTMDYITIDTTGNATDFGDLSARRNLAGASDIQ